MAEPSRHLASSTEAAVHDGSDTSFIAVEPETPWSLQATFSNRWSVRRGRFRSRHARASQLTGTLECLPGLRISETVSLGTRDGICRDPRRGRVGGGKRRAVVADDEDSPHVVSYGRYGLRHTSPSSVERRPRILRGPARIAGLGGP